MSGARLAARLASFGLDLAAPLAIRDFDALVPEPWRSAAIAPGARSAWLVGNTRALWPRFEAAPEFALSVDPLDRYVRRALAESVDGANFALYTERRSDAYLPLVALAQRAGLGVPSRIGILLHPRFGPWFGIRGVVWLDEPAESAAPLAFAPCEGCAAPCASACHGHVIGPTGIDRGACYAARLALPECALRCDARAACVVGPEHAYSATQVAHHSRIRSR